MTCFVFKTQSMPATASNNHLRSSTPIIKKSGNLVFRNQTLSDVENTRDTLVLAEGWPGMLHAMPAFFASDPQGFYMAERNYEKVGSISLVAFPQISLAYVGLFVVPKELRDQGIGKFLFETGLEHTTKQRGIATIGLNCLADMSPLYQDWGFETYTIDDIWRFTATETISNTSTNYITEIAAHLIKIIAYDALVFGEARAEFLKLLINKPGTTTVFVKNNGEVYGYGVISKRAPAKPEPNASYRIGPIYASNPAAAQEILQQLIGAVNLQSGESIFMETPCTNPAAEELLTQLGFNKLFSMEKMYRGTPPKFAEQQIFGYSSLAFGG